MKLSDWKKKEFKLKIYGILYNSFYKGKKISDDAHQRIDEFVNKDFSNVEYLMILMILAQ